MIDQTPKSEMNKDWIRLQVNVFSRWVENQLKGHADVQIENITKDLSNGVALVELAEVLTQKNAPRNWVESPKMNVQKVQNCDLAIDMFTKDGVQLVGISGKDVSDNNEKLILGLIWSLILHYSIGKSITSVVSSNKINSVQSNKAELTPRTMINKKTNALKSWAIERTMNYPNITNFSPYELSMCALLDSYVPEKINYYSLNPSEVEHNTKLASDVMSELGIPVYITSDEVNHFDTNMDDKTLLTQLASMKTVLDQHEAEKIQIHERSVTVSKHEKSDNDSESDQQEHKDNMRQIEECMRRDQEENKFLPDKVVIDGQEFTNIKVRDISLEPKVEENKDQSSSSSEMHAKDANQQEHDDNMRQIEECMRRDQEENKFLPDKVVIDGQEFTNIKVRDISLDNHESKITDNLLQDAELKVDSSKENEKSVRNDYVRISHKKEYSSFFDWFFNEVIQQPETLFGTHSRGRSPHYGWCWNLNTPIEAVVYHY
ncbi:GTPase activator activity protein [Tritrichomonas musculus]|uniref:GTPase activator activity protein n=1 Tax=Tritrichomonas musculus TaxID=1915356 RepID=A0ABR2GX96_9EUKA